jgi:hypothetical protein
MINYPRYNQWLDYWIERHANLFTMFLVMLAIVALFLVWYAIAGKRRWLLASIAATLWIVSVLLVGSPVVWATGLIALGFYFIWYGYTYILEIKIKPIYAILALALIVRIPGMFDYFWVDETFTAALSQVPMNQLGAMAGDTHPPLFYFQFWVAGHLFGYSEFALRLPSLVMGMLLIWVVYKFTLALGLDEKTALCTALIVAVMPGAVRYSNEARGYALLAVVVIGAAYAIVTNRPRMFALMSCLAILSQNMGYVYVGSLGLLALVYHHNRRWLLWCMLPGLVGLLWLPFMFRQLQSIREGPGWWVVIGPGSIIRPLYGLTIGVRVWDTYLFQVMLAVTAFTILGLLFSWRWLTSKQGVVWVTLVFIPPMSAALLSYLVTPIYIDRAFIPSVMVIPVIWSHLLTHVKQHVTIPARVVFVPMLLIALASYYFSDKNGRQDWSSLLDTGCGNAQTVYNTSLTTYFISRYYLPDREIYVWDRSGDRNLFLPDTTVTALDIRLVSTIPTGEVCLLDIDTWLSREDERDYRDFLLLLYPPSSTQLLLDNDLFPTYAHIIEVQAYDQ